MANSNTDLLTAGSPIDVANMLDKAAQRFSEDAQELAVNWQDASAGKEWMFIASEFEKLAIKIRKRWEKV